MTPSPFPPTAEGTTQQLLDELTVERHKPVPRANYARHLEATIELLTVELHEAEQERDRAIALAAAAKAHVARLEQQMLAHRCGQASAA
jgi:hypothetical protein